MRKIIFIFLVVQYFLVPAQATDDAGKKQGYVKKKDEKTNKLLYEGEFKDGKPVGKFKYYYPSDSVRAIMIFRDGGRVSYARLFHPTGKRMAEGKYIDKEIKDSTWTYYDETGTLISKDKYVKGKKEGVSFVYLPDGSLSEERHYKQDLQDGPFKQYFNGTNLRAQGNYAMGQMVGRIVYYYPNGTEAAAGFYKNGERNGPWIYKTENGKIKDKELYKNGKLASKKETDEFFSKNKTASEPTKTETKKPAAAKKNKTN